jgi:putative restriction endonuclease
MRYWWVNQNQTWRQEQAGGYLWSPKRNRNGVRNHFYETMREVAPGDIVFAFVDTFITTIGVVQSYCWESPKPTEFGDTGAYWDNVGWKVRVLFTPLTNQVRPKEHIELLRPLQPDRYAPLQANGNGIQSIYLTELRPVFAETLVALIGLEAEAAISSVPMDQPFQSSDDLDYWEHKIEKDIQVDRSLVSTEKDAIIRARRGQGLFKERVMRIEDHCRITRVSNPVHLMASHCKPWRDSTNEERLEGENGLLLTPSIDHLFDRGFIGFEGNGALIISPVAHRPSLERMGVETNRSINVGAFSEGQRHYLEFHRDMVLLKSAALE